MLVALCGIAAVSQAATITLSGTVTNQADSSPIADVTVGATRVSGLGSGQPGDSIPVESTVTTNSSGVYTFSISDSTPGLDRVLIFVYSTNWIAELYNGVQLASPIPTYSEVSAPGVVEVDFTHTVTGIDFALEASNNFSTHMIPMSDGTLLATDVYRPSGTGPWPTVLYRTTYNKNQDSVNEWPLWNARGYVVVSQDIRGTFASEDIFRAYRDDGYGDNKDGYETVQWILAQTWCNGKIGTIGGSARGISQNFLMASLPPGVICQHIGVAASDLYDQAMFAGGTFRKALAEDWMSGRGPEALAYLNTVVKAHPYPNDPFWDVMRPETRYDQVTWPTANVGGWYDIFLKGTIRNFQLLQNNGQPGSQGQHKLIIGPYGHGNPESTFAWPANSASPGMDSHNSFEWLDYWMKGIDTGVDDDPPVAYYVLGDVTQPSGPGNVWRYANTWPVPATTVSYYLHQGGALNMTRPTGSEATDVYQYDPTNPVPTLGGANLSISKGPYDQAALEARDDVVSFTTPVLQNYVEITGQVTVVLYASSSALDTDFTAKLCDVYPDGRSMIVCDGIVRARHRNTLNADELLTPGTPYEFTIDLWETCIAFNAGHRIRVDISSSNYPRFGVNTNTGEPFNQETHTVVATNTIYHDATRPSRLIVRMTGPDTNNNGVPDSADADGDGMLDEFEWTIINFSQVDAIQAIEDVAPNDDFDNDGYSNAVEFGNNTDPTLDLGALPLKPFVLVPFLAAFFAVAIIALTKRARRYA